MFRSVPTALALAAALLAGTADPARAQGPIAPETPSDSLRAFLLTFGPGEAVWEWFGHNALWIHDPEAGTDIAYHYGLFDMSEEGFILEFVQGRMLYSMGTAPALPLIDAYRRHGRDATVQELRLTSAQIRDLQRFLEWNMRPENRVYRYDYYRDNCSTRIRDALDRVTGGALRETLASQPSPMTYREQGVALTGHDPLLTAAIHVVLGPLADQPLTRWELAFIPMRLRDDLRDVSVERDGERVPLVGAERELPATGGADRPVGERAYRTSPGALGPGLLLLGLLIGALIAAAGWVAVRTSAGEGARRAARLAVVVSGVLWGLLAGGLGVFQLAVWTLTDHEFGWRNENLLQADPLALGLVVLVPLALLRGRHHTAARNLGVILAALSVLGLLLHPLPLTPQENLPVIALMLPIHLGLAWALHRTTTSNPRPARSYPRRPVAARAEQRTANERS